MRVRAKHSLPLLFISLLFIVGATVVFADPVSYCQGGENYADPACRSGDPVAFCKDPSHANDLACSDQSPAPGCDAACQAQRARNNTAVTNYFDPHQTYVNNNTIGGQIINTAGSTIIGCASGELSGLAAKGISDIMNSIGLGENSVPVRDNILETTTQCLDGAAYAVAHTLLQQVTNRTLTWVNTGFSGNPLYVRDPSSYLKSIRDEKLNDFLLHVQSSNPIFGNALRSAITQGVVGVGDGYINKIEDTPEAQQYNAFQQDFTQGGWDSLFSSIMDDQQNPIGALFNASQNVSTQINDAQQQVQQELLQGNGFLSYKICAEYEKNGYCDDPENQANPACKNGNAGIADYCKTNPNNLACQATSASAKPKCLRYETVTPGSVVAAQTASITGTTQKQLEQADKINEVLQAFFSNLLNSFLQRGLSGLGTHDTFYSNIGGGLGNNVVLGSNGVALGGVNQNMGMQQEPYDTSTFDVSRPQELRKVITAQEDFISAALDTIVAVKRTTAHLGELDYCLPGPNNDWLNGLTDNYQSFLNAIDNSSSSVHSSFTEQLTHYGPIVAILSKEFNAILGTDAKNVPTYTLLDKITNQQIQAAYPYAIADFDKSQYYSDRWAEHPPEVFAQNFSANGYQPLKDLFASAFTSTSDKDYATGFVIDAVAQTQSLIPFAQNALAIEDTYGKYIQSTQDAINELASIQKEENQIVSTAKARYISEQKAAGTPVNETCLNQAYTIDNTPIVPRPRLESDASDPVVQYSNDSSVYFYNTFLKQ